MTEICTPELRILQGAKKSDAKLQQKWQVHVVATKEGPAEIRDEWRDVPTVQQSELEQEGYPEGEGIADDTRHEEKEPV